MPNRVIRDWTDSEVMDKLSAEAERMFTRLIMKADDYGSFHANPRLIRSALFPLKEIKENDVLKWLSELVSANLVILYHAEGRQYLRVVNFGQRLRNMRNSFPQPDAQQLAANRSEKPLETKRNETEEETETNCASDSEVLIYPTFDDFWDLYGKKVGREKSEKKWAKIPQSEREAIMSYLPKYIQSTPDIQYRKNPETFLNNKSWNDEIIKPKQSANGIRNTDGTINWSEVNKSADEFLRKQRLV